MGSDLTTSQRPLNLGDTHSELSRDPFKDSIAVFVPFITMTWTPAVSSGDSAWHTPDVRQVCAQWWPHAMSRAQEVTVGSTSREEGKRAGSPCGLGPHTVPIPQCTPHRSCLSRGPPLPVIAVSYR